MNEDVYYLLRDCLHRMPGGFPEAPDGLELKVLRKLFTPEQAGIFVKLGREPEDAAAIARRCGVDEAGLAPQLEEMARRGLAFRVRAADGKPLYKAYQFFVGIVDAQVHKMDRELAELIDAYLPYVGMLNVEFETKQMRVVPVERSIKTKASVETYERMRDMVRDDHLIAVTDCMCRQMAGLKGSECRHSHETCLAFGAHAQYYLDNGIARRLSRGELMKLLDDAERWGLVIQSSNAKDLSIVCLCCPCCCGILKGLQVIPMSLMFVNSTCRSMIDAESCSGCGACLDRCPVNALQELDGRCEVLPEKCIGCGLCVSACPVECISLVDKEGGKVPLKDLPELLDTISKERGLL